MASGTIKTRWTKGYSFIEMEGDSSDLFFHVRQCALGFSQDDFLPGCQVDFEVVAGEQGPIATEVRCIRHVDINELQREGVPARGLVNSWLGHRGFGFVTTESSEDVFLHLSQVLDGTAEPGAVVEGMVTQGPKGPQLEAARVVGWEPTGDKWHDWAYMPPGWERQLAEMAESENWDYRYTDSDTPMPVLRKYLRGTFLRVSESDKIVEVESNGLRRATFNTGLVTRLQEEIVAVFEAGLQEAQRYRFREFAKVGDRSMLSFFGARQPSIARYFDNPAEVTYDDRLPLYIAIDHVDERLARAPQELQGNEYGFLSAINAQKEVLEKRVARNYKTAIPQFYRPFGRGEGSLQLLLPLCLVMPDRVDLALAVEKINGEVYRGNTVLTVDMAYTHARLLTRPDTEWLRPEVNMAGPSVGGVADQE